MPTYTLPLDSQLSVVRQAFVRSSGASNLVTDTTSFVDQGADEFINQGSRLLDRLSNFELPLMENRRLIELAVGDVKVSVNGLRVAHEVWIAGPDADSNNTRTRLERVRESDLLIEFSNLPTSSLDRGRPTKWATASLAAAPDNVGDTSATFTHDDDEVDFAASTKKKQIYILFYPPADQVYTFWLRGIFNSTELTTDTDKNFWTIHHPETLVAAATYRYYQVKGNFEIAAGYFTDMKARLHEISNDFIASEIESFRSRDMHMEHEGL